MDRFSKNQEILENKEVKLLLDAGHVVVIDKTETANDNITMLFLMAEVKGIDGNSDLSVNEAQVALLGWNKRYVRAVQSASTENADLVNIGDSLNNVFKQNFALEIKDSYEANPNFDHLPRANRDGETLVSVENGKEIYRTVSVTLAEKVKHEIISSTTESKYKALDQKQGVEGKRVNVRS